MFKNHKKKKNFGSSHCNPLVKSWLLAWLYYACPLCYSTIQCDQNLRQLNLYSDLIIFTLRKVAAQMRWKWKCYIFFRENILATEYISIYKFGLSVCLSVRLYPINVKTAEPIGPKFFVGYHVTPGKVYGWSNFQKFASIKIRFLKILKIHEFFFWKSAKFFVFIIC